MGVATATWIKWCDLAAIALLFVLGCVHNFVAAPMAFDLFDTRALWFVTGGIVLWYAAAINFLGVDGGASNAARRFAILFCNAILVGFAILFMWARGSWTNPQNIALMAPALWLLARSLVSLGARRSLAGG